MGPIQLIPPGLLGFLQLKSQGKNPRDLTDYLQGTLDLTDWYREAGWADLAIVNGGVSSVSNASGATGFVTFSTLPIIAAGGVEAWWVIDYSIITGGLTAAADVISFCPCYRPNPQGSFLGIGQEQPLLAGSAAGNRSGEAHAHGFFLPTGGELGVRVKVQETAAPLTYNGRVRYVPLQL